MLQGGGDIDPNFIYFSDQEFVMNEGLEVNVAILRASTNSMSQNCHFFRDSKKIENSYVFSIKINIRKLDTWWDQLHFLQVGGLRSNSEISKRYVAPPFERIFEDDLGKR